MMRRERAVSLRRLGILQSMRVQLPVILLGAVGGPAAILQPERLDDLMAIPELTNAMAGALLAVLGGISLIRNVTAFPGTRTFAYVLPSFAATYGLVVSCFLAFRLEYSSVYLAISFVAATLLAFLASYLGERATMRRFHVVPFGQTERILAIKTARWTPMPAPVVPLRLESGIVADLHYDHDPEWSRMLAKAALLGHPVYHTKQLVESLTGLVTIEHLSENNLGSLLPNHAYRTLKRVIDFLACLVLLPVLALPMAAVAAAIRLGSPGPAFFRQTRMGYRGQPFTMIKFRTMRTEPLAATREQAMTHSADPRITPIGRYLRHTRLDELPQLLNVLRGDMSLIGPRPEAIPLSEWYEEELPFYVYRHIVRPGISGWAQVHQGHVTNLDDVYKKLSYDFFYIKNFSAWLDILISIRTVSVMLSGFGSR